jgi:hypothetical protein
VTALTGQRDEVRKASSGQRVANDMGYNAIWRAACYHYRMFNFGKPKTAGDWIVHVAGAIVAIFLIWWMLRIYVL